MAAVAVSMRLCIEPPKLLEAIEVLEAMDEVQAVTLAGGGSGPYPMVWVTLNPAHSPLGAIHHMKHRLTAWALETGVNLIDLDGRQLTRQ